MKSQKELDKARDRLQQPATIRLGDFPVGSLKSRAAARVRFETTRPKKMVVFHTRFSWEKDHPPELVNTYTDHQGREWEVWDVPEGFGRDGK